MALKLDPQLSDAHVALAYVHRQAGRFVESLAAAQTAIQLDPNSVHGNLSAGNAYFALRRMNESLQCYETAAALDETSFISLTQATQTYDAIGDVAKSRDAAKRAMARIEKVIALQPDHTRAISFGVLMLVMLGEKDRARSWVMRGKLLDPDDYLMLYNFACAMVRLPDFDMAISLLHAVADRFSEGDLRWLEVDTDFDAMREDPRFKAFVAQIRERLGLVA
jgi:adenylate cyclase